MQMANQFLIGIGNDAENPDKFYWDIKHAYTGKVIWLETGFKTLEAAQKSLQQFKNELFDAQIITNFISKG